MRHCSRKVHNKPKFTTKFSPGDILQSIVLLSHIKTFARGIPKSMCRVSMIHFLILSVFHTKRPAEVIEYEHFQNFLHENPSTLLPVSKWPIPTDIVSYLASVYKVTCLRLITKQTVFIIILGH